MIDYPETGSDIVDSYIATINRLEPKLSRIDADVGWASVAISLKRLADSNERMVAILEKIAERMPLVQSQ